MKIFRRIASYDDDDDDVEHVESMLMRFLEDEESSLSTNAQTISQPFTGSDEVVQASLHNPHAYLGFPRDDYLELNDLYDPDSASSSSNNSSTISVHSNEYFNSEELLRYLGSTNSQNMQEEHKNYNSCFSTSAKTSQPTGLIANSVYSMKRFTA
ncbi:hypothetical protein M5K25_008844 [Dendrobium thyrsiflorum]|uniref:Uncharacterized protein n=1 Tax=Dendrobium thyrsiflorum TaxID=117978 RepID=A0ABD0VAD0_DENTH